MSLIILPSATILTNSQGADCSLFLIFTTQQQSLLCNYNVLFCIYWQEGSFATGILPTPNVNTPLLLLPVGSKYVYEVGRGFILISS